MRVSLRRREEEVGWGSSPFNQATNGHPSRSVPDYDNRARRFRNRHVTSRTTTQTPTRGTAYTSPRANRNSTYQYGMTSSPTHSNHPSLDDDISTGPRSVTPHPTWSATPAVSGRPSSLPAAGSPLREANNHRDNTVNSPSATGSNTISPPLLERQWSDTSAMAVPAFPWAGSPGVYPTQHILDHMNRARVSQTNPGNPSALDFPPHNR
jgi:hypothetical protein